MPRPVSAAATAIVAGVAFLLSFACASGARPAAAPVPALADPTAASAPDRAYYAWVVAESADQLALLRFDSTGLHVERVERTGLIPTEINGPHGVGVTPDDAHVFVSVAHGTPYGSLWKYDAAKREMEGHIPLALFPTTLQVSPDGQYVYVVNSNFHGYMVPSVLSIVSTDPFVEVARLTTCTMPHGSRLDPTGERHYSACMMDDALVEVDTRRFEVARHFVLTKGHEHGGTGTPPARGHVADTASAHGHASHGGAAPLPVTCSPTWAQPSAGGGSVFVACNKSDEIVEIDVADWTITRRMPAGAGVYNLAVTSDNRLLIATNKRGQSVSIFDVASGRELARLPTQRKIVHGIAITDDDRYAFITVEGIGAEPGTVEVIDLRTLTTVARADVGQQAAGVEFWKSVEVGR